MSFAAGGAMLFDVTPVSALVPPAVGRPRRPLIGERAAVRIVLRHPPTPSSILSPTGAKRFEEDAERWDGLS